MVTTIWAMVRNGKIEPLENTDLSEGSIVLVTLIPEDEAQFLSNVDHLPLQTIWDNAEDNVYAALLTE